MIFYEYPKCSTCRDAKKELIGLGIEVESVDIKTNPPQIDILKGWLASGVELKKLFNASGNSYRALGLKDNLPTLSVDEALALLASDGMLIKRPVLVDGDKVLQIGYRTPYSELGL